MGTPGLGGTWRKSQHPKAAQPCPGRRQGGVWPWLSFQNRSHLFDGNGWVHFLPMPRRGRCRASRKKLLSSPYLLRGKGCPVIRYFHVLGLRCFFFFTIFAWISGPLDQRQNQTVFLPGCHPPIVGEELGFLDREEWHSGWVTPRAHPQHTQITSKMRFREDAGPLDQGSASLPLGQTYNFGGNREQTG